MTPTRLARLGFLLFLLVYGVACLRTPDAGRLLDGVDLAIHETGHLVFAPFGDTLGILGGTLFQLIVPLVFTGYFVRRRERFGAAACLWWVAQNCWHISVYVADARAQELPLVGGGEHDWAMLLGQWRLLARDTALAHAVHSTGVLLFVSALVLGLIAALADERSEGGVPEEAAIRHLSSHEQHSFVRATDGGGHPRESRTARRPGGHDTGPRAVG